MTVPTTSQGSLMRWNKIIREEGISKLAGAYGNRKGSGIINQNKEIQNFILSMIHDFPHCKSNHVYQGILARFHNLNLDLPDLRTVSRWMRKWKQENKELFTLIDNPDEWRNKFMVAIGDASEKVERYLQLWEMDSTPADIMLEDGRYTIIGLVDVWSRRFKLLVSKTSKSVSVAALIRHCILDWGVPETIKTDNGADYVSYHITRTLKLLEIEQELCTPFQPWEKPHVERAFGTFSRNLLELMSGFIGHNVAERKAIEERRSFADRLMKKGETVHLTLTSEQLQSFCDKWTEHIYFHRKHTGTNKSPFEMVNSWQNPVRVWSNSRALDLLLAEAPGKNGERRVGKKGIALDKFMYWADELIEHVGKTVRVYYDPINAGRIQVYDHGMNSICTAECPNITGISRKELAKKATQIQKKRISEAKSNLKSISRKNSTKNISTEISEHCAEQNADLVALPKQTIEYSTQALQSASDAIENIDAMAKPSTFEELDQAGSESFSPEAQARVAEIIHLDMKRKNAKDTEEYDKDLREKRYEDLLARNFKGINEDDDNWRKSWETTPEFYAWEMLKELKLQNSLPSQENA